MSKVFKCDNCQKTEVSKGITITVETPYHIKHKEDLAAMHFTSKLPVTEVYELCVDCTDKFMKFVEEHTNER